MKIYFIRHGEKVESDPIHLSEIGKKRAKELPNFFKSKNIDIDFIIAMKQHNENSSNRPVETVTGLSKKLDLKIHDKFTSNEIKEAVKYILKKSKEYNNILVCWEHEYLVEIVIHLTKLTRLKWGLNPLSEDNNEDDYTPLWIIESNEQGNFELFSIYNEFDIIENYFDESFDGYVIDYQIDYSNVSKTSFLECKLNKFE